jgi:hypothetical protein
MGGSIMSRWKVNSGQPWKPERALDHNAKSTATDHHRRSNQNVDGQRDRTFDVDSNIVYVRNQSAVDTDRGEVLALMNTPTDYQERLLTKCDREKMWLPADVFDDLEATLVLAIDPIPAGSIGPAQVAGAGVALVNVSNVNHTHAKPVEGEVYLESGTSGPARLLHKPESTGERLCIVLLGTPIDTQLYEFCLAENHPGRGIVFEVTLGTWDPDDHDWCFEGDPVKAIDWRYDVPYPDAGARGQGYFKPSTTHGRILIPIDMDCDSPGACPDCNGGS